MAFNHYAKIKRIIASKSDWYIVRINQPTSAKNFKGKTRYFEYYYRIYGSDGQPIKYCKFQQLELLAKTLGVPADSLPIVTHRTPR